MLTLDQVIVEMQQQGWHYNQATVGRVVYSFFESDHGPHWPHTPRYTFYYSLGQGQPEWRLWREQSAEDIASWKDPLTSENLVEMWGMCSRNV